jgi:hypothetical protein
MTSNRPRNEGALPMLAICPNCFRNWESMDIRRLDLFDHDGNYDHYVVKGCEAGVKQYPIEGCSKWRPR